MSEQIQIVPNSGHQFFWTAFKEAALQQLSLKGKATLTDFCIKPKSWETVKSGEVSRPWARYRYGYKFSAKRQRQLGVWLCLDSNLGDVSRGSVLAPSEEVAERPFTGQPQPPYAFRTENEISENGRLTFAFDFPKDGETGADMVNLAEINVYWPVTMAQAPIPVDLIVDFGNTRTVALLLEEIPAGVGTPSAALKQMVRPLKFLERGTSYSDDLEALSIVDSWFVLHQPQFSNFEIPAAGRDAGVEEFDVKVVPPKTSFWGRTKGETQRLVTHATRRIPQMFVELSPVMLGNDAVRALRAFRIAGGGVSFMSSPKRYAWDCQPADIEVGHNQVVWAMVRNDWDQDRAANQNAMLACQALRFFPHDGTDWVLNDPPTNWEAKNRPAAQPVQPVFPKADSLAWMALSVIETAYRQMNAEAYWKDHFPYVRRYLRSVQVTFPSGWTGPELRAYKSKWTKAVNVFAHGHLANPSEAPAVEFPIDEAIASQLPIIFAEIQNMGGQGENWLSLMGKVGSDKIPRVRALTIDIGGGTTDYSVVEYSDAMVGVGVDLGAKLLFKDSTNIAGDWLVKALIERLLLPKLGERFKNEERASDAYESFFRQSFSTQAEKEQWKRITRLVLVPQVISWLQNLCQGRDLLTTSSKDVMDSGVVEDMNQMCESHFQALGLGDRLPEGKLIRLEGTEDQITIIDVTSKEIAAVAEEVFRPTVASMAKFITAFDIDLVIVAGKPSELPVMQELLFRSLPISRDRVVFAKNFYAGDWYPFNFNGKILDAKTVTAVGLALYRAISTHRVAGWAIHREICDSALRRNYWLRVPDSLGQKTQVLLDLEADIASVELMLNTRIGRRFLPSSRNPEPTYILKWKNPVKQPPPRLLISLRRTPANDSEGSEELRIETVSAVDQRMPLSLTDVSLELCTLDAEEYWLDHPRFKVLWDE